MGYGHSPGRPETKAGRSDLRRSERGHPGLARRAGPDFLDGPLRGLPEGARPHLRSGLRIFRALSLRTVHHHVENFIYGTAIDEAHPAGLERGWRPQRRAADGDREPSGRRAYWTHDHDLRGFVAGRQCWLVLRGRRRCFLSLTDPTAGAPEQLSGLDVVVEFCL